MYFEQGKVKYLLITERFTFFRRYPILGMHHLIYYQLPDHSLFYKEFVNQLESVDAGSKSRHTCNVLALYTKHDQMQLERIIGSERAQTLLTSKKSLHMFT